MEIEKQHMAQAASTCSCCWAAACHQCRTCWARLAESSAEPLSASLLEQVLAKIHQTYRLQYLKDVILPRSLDDATYATLTSLALFNNVEVLMALQVSVWQ